MISFCELEGILDTILALLLGFIIALLLGYELKRWLREEK